MSTDSIIEFKFSDGEHLCGIYIPSDTHHNEFIPKLSALFAKADDDNHRHRLNWDYLVTKVIGELISTLPKIKLLGTNCDFKYVIYRTTITPISDMYATKENAVNDAINICVCRGSKRNAQAIYDGLLSKFAPIVDEDN